MDDKKIVKQTQGDDQVGQVVQAQVQDQQSQPVAGSAVSRKEHLPTSVVAKEKVADGVVEQWSEQVEMEPEVEAHVEKVIHGEVEIPKGLPIVDEKGEKVLESAQSIKSQIVLPISEETARRAKKLSVKEALRWLEAFCRRIKDKYPKSTIWATSSTKEV